MKYNRFSFPSSVSGDLQILHVTYSTNPVSLMPRPASDSPMYFRSTFSICFCVYLPFITNLCAPSTDPCVPSSE